MRALITLGAALILSAAMATPAFAGMTKCLCDNGRVINTTRKGDRGCNSACKIHGGGGRVWTPEDKVLEDDSTVVVPRRPGGPARPRR